MEKVRGPFQLIGPVEHGWASAGRRYWVWYEEIRAPKEGEFYMSGAIPEIYQAPADLSTVYRVVVLDREAKLVQRWE